jgi:hypothetical protein
MTLTIRGVSIPDSKLAREITELVRDTESPLLFHHSSRVYYFGALAGKHQARGQGSELQAWQLLQRDSRLGLAGMMPHFLHPGTPP